MYYCIDVKISEETIIVKASQIRVTLLGSVVVFLPVLWLYIGNDKSQCISILGYKTREKLVA